MSKSWKAMYEDAIRVRRNDLARLCVLEKALKLGWTIVAGESYDGACDCATCLPKREFLKSVETLTSPDRGGVE